MKHSSGKPAIVAVDLGAESCRVSLLQWIDGQPEIQVVHRFPNAPRSLHGKLVWDIEGIYQGIVRGLQFCAEAAKSDVASIGVDGWSVDYVRLAPQGIEGVAVCYRDERTVEAVQRVHERIPPERLYDRTGIQFLRFNTLYQLYADGDDRRVQRLPWVMLPEYILLRLGARRVAEYTNATHTALVQRGALEWSSDVFAAAELEMAAAPTIVPPGTIAGTLSAEFDDYPRLRDARLIAPACHDTASAIAGIPAVGDDWAFISSGTWSLVGTSLPEPCASDEARSKNFTNLGGVGGMTYFLKNVNGMWLLRQCIEQWRAEGFEYGLEALVAACAHEQPPDMLLDVDDPDLLLPEGMHTKLNAQRIRSGLLPVDNGLQGAVTTTNLILHSLSARYADALADIARITGKRLARVYIVGGGSNNTVLNRMTEERTGLSVQRGSVESSTIGNFAIQLAQLEGAYSQRDGVNGKVVAHWANELASAPIRAAVAAATETNSLQEGR